MWYHGTAYDVIYSLNCDMFSESVFRLVCKSKIGETVVDSARHSFSRRRALVHQLFAKYLFDELNDTILISWTKLKEKSVVSKINLLIALFLCIKRTC